MRGIVHLLREFSSSYFFVPGACDRPISCWEPTNQTFMAAAWATCSLAQNYLWLVLPRKTWFSRSECPGSRHVFWSFNGTCFCFHFGCHGFSTCESLSMRKKCQSVEIFQCDGHRRIALPHAIGLASADRTAKHQPTVGMPKGQWCAGDKDERKSFSKRPLTQGRHWDWMTLASWDFGSIFGTFFEICKFHVFCITHQG